MQVYFEIKARDYKEEDFPIDLTRNFVKELHLLRDKKIFKWIPQTFRIHFQRSFDKKVKIIFGCNLNKNYKRKQVIKKLLNIYYGENSFEEIKKPIFSTNGRLMIAQNPMYSLQTNNFIYNTVMNLPENTILTIDFKANDKLKKYLLQTNDYLKESKGINEGYHYELKVKDNKKLKEKKYLFNLDFYINQIELNGVNNVYSFCKKLRVYTDGEVNSIRAKKLFGALNPNNNIQFAYKTRAIATEEDLANILWIPPYEKLVGKVYCSKPKIDKEKFNSGILVGDHQSDEKEVFPFRISLKQLSKHMFLCAGTGGGKSSLLFTMLDDLVSFHKQKYGATIIDPNEETLIKFINHALAMEKNGLQVDWDKIHYIDLVNGKYLPSLNLLNIPYAQKDIDIIQSYIMETLKAVYPGGSTPKIDEQLRKVIGTLLLENRKNTILDANELLTSKKRQKQAQKNLGDGYYEQAYKMLWDNPPKASEVDSTLRRLNLFQSPQMQRIFGLPEFDLPIQKWMDEGHIVLINTKGLSEEKLKLNAGHILSQYVMVAKTRGTSGSLPHFLIIDEGKQFQLPIIWKNIIPEARKFGLYLIETTQTITSLEENFKNEIIENVNTIISGRLGDSGARIVSKMMNDQINPKTLKNLEDFHLLAYTRGTDNQVVSADIKVTPPYWYFLKDDKVKIARYENAYEETKAEKWAQDKIHELQKRDWRHVNKLDELLKQRYGKHIEKPKIIKSDTNNIDSQNNGLF